MKETGVITSRPTWLQNPLLFPAAAALAGMSWLGWKKLGMSGPLTLVLLAQAVLFVLLLRRPIWAMAALIVGQLTAINYMLPLGGQQITVRLLWVMLALLLLVPILWKKGGIKLGSRARRIIIPAAIFLGWTTIANFVNTDLPHTVQYFRLYGTGLLILILLPATVKNERDIKRLALVVLIICSVSAIVALMQHYWFKGLTLYGDEISRGRVSGLSESPVQLGFNLPVVLLPMVALYFLKGVDSRVRKLLILFILLIGAALYFTFTRSGVYALAPGLLLMILLMKGKPKKELFLVTLLLGAAFLYYVNTADVRYSKGFKEDSSAATRLVLWQVGLNVALDNSILGIGFDRFEEVSVKYASTISSSLWETQGAGKALGRYEAHNDFITAWASFGIVALLAYLCLFVGIFRNFLDAYRHSRTRFLKGFAVGCFGAVAAYIVNAFTHNMLGASQLLWILGGLSIATTKIALSKQPRTVKEIR